MPCLLRSGSGAVAGRRDQGYDFGTPLGIPGVEALHMKLKRLLTGEYGGNALHHELFLRDARIAGSALFPVSWATPESRHAVIRQPSIVELTADEKTKSFDFHWLPLSRVGSR